MKIQKISQYQKRIIFLHSVSGTADKFIGKWISNRLSGNSIYIDSLYYIDDIIKNIQKCNNFIIFIKDSAISQVSASIMIAKEISSIHDNVVSTDILVLRDPFNTFANSDADMSNINLWKAHAEEFIGYTNKCKNKTCINFNLWASSQKYRTELEELMGLTNDSETDQKDQLDKITDIFDNSYKVIDQENIGINCQWKGKWKNIKFRSLFKKDIWNLYKIIFSETGGNLPLFHPEMHELITFPRKIKSADLLCISDIYANQGEVNKNIFFLPYLQSYDIYYHQTIREIISMKPDYSVVCCLPGHECLFNRCNECFTDWISMIENDKNIANLNYQDYCNIKAKVIKKYPKYKNFSFCVPDWKRRKGNLKDINYTMVFPYIRHALICDIAIAPIKIDYMKDQGYAFWKNILNYFKQQNKIIACVGENKKDYCFIKDFNFYSWDFGVIDPIVEIMKQAKLNITTNERLCLLGSLIEAPQVVIKTKTNTIVDEQTIKQQSNKKIKLKFISMNIEDIINNTKIK